jgi:hypothetical protein
LTPGRLELHDDAVVGVTDHTSAVVGSYDPNGNFVGSPASATEIDLEEDVIGTVRVLSKGQVTLLVPFVETYRSLLGDSEFGGGVGDINLSARYDFTSAGQSRRIPGIALLLAVTLPTGRAPEQARQTLGTDATGIGAFQGTGGIALEQTVDRFLFNLSAWVTQRAPRHVEGLSETLGLQVAGLAGVGYTLSNEWVVAGTVSYTGERDAVINGQRLADSGRSLTVASAVLALPIGENWRLQATVFDDLPFWGRNQPSAVGVTVTLLRSWT